ncbi:MAG: UDP-2,3-diacylglucosamine diphosphatase, partial [Halioglobus sp.]|nr:UDP-2,3-diacylglucosamine diphosphatase [Halioglobus sp.]
MSRTLFISDLHLDASRPGITRALDDFLRRNTECERLYILGDLFEAWIGDDDDRPLVAAVAELLRRFTAAGPRLYLMQGNRDFLLGANFCRRVGAQLLPDPSLIDLYGTPTLLLHGDSLCTGDSQYQAFRRTARDPAWQVELLARSLQERRALAAQLRGMSQQANSNKAQDIMDVAPQEVERVMRKYGVSQLIHGHTHRPARHDAADGSR